ncbi:MAG: hypothetical protein LWY06_10360 [Firmicutes bacterium]|nr:hypothetical protein [Bacillota bacterium]
MALSDLTEKILADAKAEAQKIISDAKAEAESLLAEARADLEAGREKLGRETERIAREKYTNIVTLAKIEARNRTLLSRQKMISRVFERVREKMEAMEPSVFEKFAFNLLLRFPPSEITEIQMGRKHSGFDSSKLILELNRKISGKSGGKFVLASKPADFDWGFKLFSGEMQVDLTFGSLVESYRLEMETEISRILFTKG